MIYSRIIIEDKEDISSILKKLKAEKKSEFSFYDLIYLNENGRSITEDTLKIRVYQKNEWKNKNVLVIQKNALPVNGGKEDKVLLREEFDTEEEAKRFVEDNFKNQYEYKFTLQKSGEEYENTNLRIWVENIKDIGISIEFGSTNSKSIEKAISLFKVKERMNESVPEYLYKKYYKEK